MSLSVSVFVFDDTGEKVKVELDKGKDLAGFESSRYKLYGSKLAESLRLKLLPQLKSHDLWDVGGDQLNELESELKTIIENVEAFSKESEFEQEYIKARVQNILDAIQIAREKTGVIW
jgi:hypothetical protein